MAQFVDDILFFICSKEQYMQAIVAIVNENKSTFYF
jgi:uncharacterized protein (DUF169 family)